MPYWAIDRLHRSDEQRKFTANGGSKIIFGVEKDTSSLRDELLDDSK
jgi:hypothetical protein